MHSLNSKDIAHFPVVVTYDTTEEEDSGHCNATADSNYHPLPPGQVQVGGEDGWAWGGRGLLQVEVHTLEWRDNTVCKLEPEQIGMEY